MKRWMGPALWTAGALMALLAIGRPASADLVGVTINPKGTASGGYAVVSGTLTATDAASTPGRAGSCGARASADSKGKVVAIDQQPMRSGGGFQQCRGKSRHPGG